MKNSARRLCAAAVALSLLLSVAPAAIAAGTGADPLVSKKYTETVFKPFIFDYVRETTGFGGDLPGGVFGAEVKAAADAAMEKISNETAASAIADALLSDIGDRLSAASLNRRVTLAAGQRLVLSPGATVTVLSGSAAMFPDGGGTLVSLTEGAEYAGSRQIGENRVFLVSEKGGVTVESSSGAVLLVSGTAKVEEGPAYTPVYTDLADALKKMSLFVGTDIGYELERAASRGEAIVMMVRLLGKEKAAVAVPNPTTPFDDVPSWWLLPYAAYAYNAKLTFGVGGGQFGTGLYVTADEYMTFVLRSLGYLDTGDKPDFNYKSAVDSAVDFSVITRSEAAMLKSGRFTRDKMVFISYYSLLARTKDGAKTLLQKLIDEGAVDRAAAESAMAAIGRGRS